MIILISAASLAYEITLTRIFAVQQFYHFAFVVISIATMGFAASGVLISMRKRQPAPYLLALVFLAATLLAYITINMLPFDSYSIAWDKRQWWILLLYFIVSGLPFLAASWAIGAALNAAGTEAHIPYSANLLGAALGCPLALLAIEYLGAEGTIGLMLCLGLFAASLLLHDRRAVFGLVPITVFILIAFGIPLEPLRLSLSAYKPLSSALLARQSRATITDWGLTTRLDVVESPGIHSFPGLSLNLTSPLPEQAGVFLDGEGPVPITHLSPEDPLSVQVGDRLPSSIAYSLRSARQALILDWGAGTPVLFALAQSSAEIWLPNELPILIELLRGPYADYSNGLLEHPDLSLLGRSSRGALARQDRSYDVIEFALSDPYRPVTTGAFSLGEDYLLTQEAFVQAWNRLQPDGLMAITRWLGTPPSESARAWNTLLAALRSSGLDDLQSHVVAFRGMRTATMIASPRAFSESELQDLRDFLIDNAFDPLVLPDLQNTEVNHFNRLPEPVYHELFTDLLNAPVETARAYSFRLEPPEDDRPFFFHYFRWGQTPEVLATLGLFWQPFGGSGYFVLLVLMGLMVALAVLLLSASLHFTKAATGEARASYGALLYFGALGAGYLLVEIPLIQQFTLLLDHPAISLAGVLFILLLGSGIGSRLSPRFETRKALFALLAYLAFTIVVTPDLIARLLPCSALVRLLSGGLLLLPLGVLMGIPFAAGLSKIELGRPGWIPWAWAVNGAFSGISGVAAVMLTLDLGLRATLIAGWLAYGLACLSSTRIAE